MKPQGCLPSAYWEYRQLLATVSIRRLWPMRADKEARFAIRQWLGDLRKLKEAASA